MPTVPRQTPVLLSDPRVSEVRARECGEPLTELDESFGPCRALVRASVARLAQARDYGDRYWALATGAPAALYGLVAADRVV